MKKVLIALLALAGALPGAAHSAGAADALYQRANTLYQEGKYDEAAESYRQALAAGLVHPDLYYNLGNAEFRRGRLGPAIADYLRAQKLSPRDPDVAFNLDYARGKISGRIQQLPRGPLLRAFDQAAGTLSGREWIIVLAACYWGAALAGIVLVLARRAAIQTAARRLLVLAAAALVLALPFGTVEIKRDLYTPRAVITAEKVVLRSGPDQDLPELVELREGMDVVVGKCENGWCHLSAPGGFVGWARAETFERL